jgi:dTDP-4-dehydrorhamnose 3,5-epimerase
MNMSASQRGTPTVMEVAGTDIAEIKILKPVRHADSRGFFSEIYRENVLSAHGIDVRFVQENHSLSASKGVLRGLHFQIPPFTQAKLVRVTAGSIFDVAVDIRWGSPDFGRHVALVLSVSEWNQIFIPEGFAHGFCTLEPNTEVVYKASNYYSAEHDRGLCWNDPALAIDWPVALGEPVLSDKDRHHPKLAELPRFFQYEPPVPRLARIRG